MLITDVKRNEGNNIGHVGLALIGEMARVCARITRHARKVILYVSCPKPWFKVVSGLLYRLKTA